MAMFISQYLFGRASDYYGRRIFLLVGLASSAITFLLQFFIYDFFSFLWIRTITGVCLGIYPAALIAYVHESKRKLGNFSSFGALGWLFGMIISGILAEYLFLRSVFIFSSIWFLIAFLIAWKLGPIKHKPMRVPLFPKHILKKNLAIYSGVLIRHSGAHLMWVFWPLYLRSLGATFFWVGIIQAVNAVSQVLVMYFIMDRVDYRKSIYFGLFLSGVTFLSFAFAQDYLQLLPTQVFLGMSWSFMYVGSIIYINKHNEERGTANGILTSILNFSSLIGSVFAVVLIAIFNDYRAIIIVAALFAFIGFGVFTALFRSNDKDTTKDD
jgi:MFS family permease